MGVYKASSTNQSISPSLFLTSPTPPKRANHTTLDHINNTNLHMNPHFWRLSSVRTRDLPRSHNTQRKPPSWGLGTPNTSPGETNHPRGMKHTIIRAYIKHPTPKQSPSHLIQVPTSWPTRIQQYKQNSTVKGLNKTNIPMLLTPTSATCPISKYQHILICCQRI